MSNLTMDSLALPNELYWDGKMEPISPPSGELFPISDLTDHWLYDCNFATGLPSLLDDDDIDMEPKQIIEVTHELTNGDDVVVELCNLKDEFMLDSKLLDYSIGIDVAQPHIITKVQSPLASASIFNPSSFDNAVLAQLTPPQSPPRNSASSSPEHQNNSSSLFIETQNNFSGAFSGIISPGPQSPASPSSAAVAPPPIVSPISFLSSAEPVIIPNAVPSGFTFNWTGTQESVVSVPSIVSTGPSAQVNTNENLERDLQLLDEIVNTRAKELCDWNAREESETQSSFSGPSQAGSVTSDDDWQPESCYSSSVSSPNYQHSSDEQISSQPSSSGGATNTTSTATTTKKRTRQYGRGVEDRKIRKKEQNKNAATRYRQKKKLEMESVLIEEQKLLERNAELQRILAEAKREAKYLKSLLREFFATDKSKP